MKLHRQLQVGDVVGLIGLHEAYPKMGVIRAIDGETIGVHWTTGAPRFQNTQIHEQTLWVPRRSVWDTRSWRGWIKAFLSGLRK